MKMQRESKKTNRKQCKCIENKNAMKYNENKWKTMKINEYTLKYNENQQKTMKTKIHKISFEYTSDDQTVPPVFRKGKNTRTER